MKLLIYKAVFGGYDKVFPVLRPFRGADYVIFTDDATLKVMGWKTICVDTAGFKSGKEANLHFRALVHKYLPNYDVSLYIDGNVRIISNIIGLCKDFLHSKADIGIFAHTTRSKVIEEVAACAAQGRADHATMLGEYSVYLADGFKDDVGLFDGAIHFKNHTSDQLNAAMEHWWRLFQTYNTRDQLSLPYVVWKHNLKVHLFAGSNRVSNKYFQFYPHLHGIVRVPIPLIVKAYSRDRFLFWLAPLYRSLKWLQRRLKLG